MKKISILILFFVTGLIYSQNNPYFDPQIKTPGVSDFVKYGNLSSTSYTGELKIDIPLLNIDIPKQNPLEVSLSHVASGFRPSKRNGIVGQNWFLNVGGAITREINGMPDDQKGSPNCNGCLPNYTNGFIVGVQNKTYTSAAVFGFNSSTVYVSTFIEPYLYANSTSTGTDPNNYEADPDIFNFNFNGISGKFFMGNDGQVKVITSEPHQLKVDLSELAFQDIVNSNYVCKPKTPSRIVITDEKGNKYYFGGETKNLEYSLTLIPSQFSNNGSTLASNNRPVISSWFLYKIEYYTGYNLYFNYKDDSSLLSNFANENEIHLLSNEYPASSTKRDFIQLSEYYSDSRALEQTTGSMSSTGGSSSTQYGGFSMTVQKIAILDNIQGENFTVSFNYSRQDHKFNTRDHSNLPEPNGSYFNNFIDIKLNSISFSGRTFWFNYSYLGGSTHSRMFLSSVKETGKQPHVFEYYPTGNLPQPITFGIDHWGFWNGKAANTNALVPYTLLDSNGDFSYSSTNTNSKTRDPNFTYALKGQLKKVTYPTGGYTEFEYDTHSYTKRLECRSTNSFIPQLYVASGIAGGVRIQKTTDFDSFNNVNVKEYEYLSSGTLLMWPRYAAYWGCDSQYFGYIRSNPIGKNIMENIILSYGSVKEITSGNGYTVTSFRDFQTNPDTDQSNFINASSYASCATPSGLAKNYVGYFLNNRSIERGKPSKIQFYSETAQLKKEIRYEYNESTDRFNNYTAKIHLTGPFVQSNKIYHYQDYLSKETVREYSQSIFQFFGTDLTKTYDANTNMLTAEKKYNRFGELEQTNYSYLSVPGLNLVLNNKKESYVNAQKTFEQQILYGNESDPATNNKYLPKKISAAKFPSDGILEDRFSFVKYDAKSNPVEVKVENGMSIVYLWGYSKSLLIAKIENATLSEVAAALGINEAQLINYTESNLTEINALRSNTALSQSMITTYTHLPHIGIQSITDPKNETFTFMYDSAKRLSYVQDSQGKITSEYLYHYANE
jgi:hypothetical protein